MNNNHNEEVRLSGNWHHDEDQPLHFPHAMRSFIGSIVSCVALLGNASAFAPGGNSFARRSSTPTKVIAPITLSSFDNSRAYTIKIHPVALQRQRSSVASIQTMGLFGLGGPEIAIILIAGAFLLGPQKLAELGKEAGKMAGELKEVPKEFQAGLAEGEKEAMKIKKEIAGSIKDADKVEV